MKETHFRKPHVYIALFRCGQCSGPVLNRIVSEGPYPETDLPGYPFPVECSICQHSGTRHGSEALKLERVEWNLEIHFVPHNEST
jgi:predicted metal-binding protein